ncbi:MAG: PEP/pyruvate-binding domain-containing protein [Patescibacteria group bacterium]
MFSKVFEEITKKNVKEAGGKGASLGEMTHLLQGFGGQAHGVVPPGFVVLAGAFDRFLKETNLNLKIEAVLKKVKSKDLNSVEVASEKIRALMEREKIPKDIQVEIKESYQTLSKGRAMFVAVRSSATAEDSKAASWAGELETYLNVTEKNLMQSVMKCWSSLFTPRAIFYRFEKKLHRTPVSVAVVVQQMVQSEVSGIAFTVHPVTKDYNQMVIEAGFGLGEAIVSGQVTPDTYVIDKKKFGLLDINVSTQKFKIVRGPKGNSDKKLSEAAGSKQKLTGKEIIELAKLCVAIEKHYKHPQDIEWAFVKGKFYITQSRPITTLG